MSFFTDLKNKISNKDKSRYLNGFSQTNKNLGKKLHLLSNNNQLTKEEFREQLMVTLLSSDVGFKTANHICDLFSKKTKFGFNYSSEELFNLLIECLKEIYNPEENNSFIYNQDGPTVILIVGINGSGKTTSCAKLANIFKQQNKKVCLAAGDTFRAGAREQLVTWANKLDIDIVTGKENEDPSSVLVNACRFSKENNIDVLICDTAGRLQNKTNLMNELAKMKRVINKEITGAPQYSWLVIDANTGQNGLSQAELFNQTTELSGIILTKMDGTSKGGIVLAIKDLFNIPVKYVGLGEGINDLEEFDFNLYLYSIVKELDND